VRQLFITLYLDEDVNVMVANLLNGRGFSATTARDEGLLSKSDEEQLAYAVSQQKTLLTHNRHDFEMLAREYADAGRMHYGIILAVRYPPYEVIQRLMRILDRVTADEIQNQVRYI